MFTKLARTHKRFASIAPQNIATQRRITVGSHEHAKSLSSILIANRGEIALRVERTATQYGVKTTTLYTDPDARAQHAMVSSFSIGMGEPSAYLDGDRIIEVATVNGCDCIHPGYGFLSENSVFARKCADAGLVFIGPPPDAIEAMGNKSRSKEIMTAAGVPCVPGYHGSNQDEAFLLSEAGKIGFPVILKAVKGGGGKGMRISASANDFKDQLASAKSEAKSSFGDDTMLVEKYITTPRHIEVQVFADKHGNCVALGERDCSIQRRHQKIIEESPAPNLEDNIRKDLWHKACNAALAVNYEGAGTVEFIFDNDTGEFFFMEMNTRLQVEHPVTEMVTGQDLVHWQLQIAEGRKLPLNQEEIERRIAELGWAFEARIYAENPDRGFIPDSGTLLHMRLPKQSEYVRVDAGFVQGDEISSHYDPMIAKLIVRGSSRQEALHRLNAALQDYQVAGPTTNIEFLKRICTSSDFIAGFVETGYIDKHKEQLFAKEILTDEVWAQTAIGLVLQDEATKPMTGINQVPGASKIGFGPGQQVRRIELEHDTSSTEAVSKTTTVSVTQRSVQEFDVTVDGRAFHNVAARLTSPNQLETYFRHLRMTSVIVQNGQDLSVFSQGKQYRMRRVAPQWLIPALGTRSTANSVLAPMPCKVLRVEVIEGDEVRKDQALVVIESMKMETIIRSPHDGKIAKVMHKAGDICKAGTALVEFADSSSD